MATNLGFYRGAQSAIDSFIANGTGALVGKVVEGSFYLASDTNRLYVGKAGNTLAPVNEGVIKVANIAALPKEGTFIPGQFYYAEAENVLCIYSKGQWVQINPVVYNESLTNTVSVASNVAQVSTKVTQANAEVAEVSDAVKFADGQTNTDKSTITFAADATNKKISMTVDGYKTSVIDTKISAVSTELTQAKTDLTASIGEVSSSLTKEVQDRKDAVKAVEDKVTANTTAIGTKASQADHDTLAGRVSTAEEKITALEKTSADDVADLTAKVEENTNAIKANDTAIKANAANIETANGRIDTVSGNVSSLTERMSAVEKKATDNATTIGTNTNNITALQGTVGEHGTAISQINTTLGQVSDKADANETAIEGLTTRMSAVETKATTNATNIGKNTTAITALQNKDTEIEGKVAENTSVISALDTRVTEVNNTLSQEIETVETTLTNKINTDLKAYNAMEYKGTVGSGSEQKALPTSGVKIGDAYLVSGGLTHSGTAYPAGTLAIAKGTEVDGVITSGLEWTFVTGSQVDTQFSGRAISNGFAIQNDTTEADVGHVTFASLNENLVVAGTQTSGKNQVINVNLVWGTF